MLIFHYFGVVLLDIMGSMSFSVSMKWFITIKVVFYHFNSQCFSLQTDNKVFTTEIFTTGVEDVGSFKAGYAGVISNFVL